MPLVDLEVLTTDALSLTEKVVEHVIQSGDVSKQACMDIRQHVFPLLSKFLAEDVYNYHTSVSVLNTLVGKLNEKVTETPRDSYKFSQADMSDGLEMFSQTQEFQGILKSMQWGIQHRHEERRFRIINSPNASLGRQELYKYILYFLQGDTIQKICLPDANTTENEHNHNILNYHGKRFTHILRQQANSFIPEIDEKGDKKEKQIATQEENVGLEAKPQPSSNATIEPVLPSQDIYKPLFDEVNALLEHARIYRTTVHQSLATDEVAISATADQPTLQPLNMSAIKEASKETSKETSKEDVAKEASRLVL